MPSNEAAGGRAFAIIILSINVIPVLSSFGRQASHKTYRHQTEFLHRRSFRCVKLSYHLCIRSAAHCVLLSTNSRFVCHPPKDHLVQSDFSFKWELSCVLETQPLIRTHYRHRRREDGEPSNCGMSQNLVATLLHPHDSIRCHVLVGQLRLPWTMEGVWHQLWTILSLLIYFLNWPWSHSRCI